MLNARIRKAWLADGVPIGLIGFRDRSDLAVTMLGAAPSLLTDLHDGTHDFAKVLAAAKKPMIIVGQGALARPDGGAVLAAAWRLAAQVGALTAGLARLQRAAHGGRRGLARWTWGLCPVRMARAPTTCWAAASICCGCWVPTGSTRRVSAAGTFVVYQGHHGDAGAQRADVILPGAAYTEKSGTYVNTEGRVQRGFMAVYPPGEAREDWTILRAFSAVVGKTLPVRHDRSPAQANGAGQSGVRPCRLPAALRLLRPDRAGRRSRRAVRCALGLVDGELLPDRSDQPGQPDHGGVRRGAVDVGPRWHAMAAE